MDSVTQFVLGAAVGEATLRGGDVGKKRFTYGAALLGGLMGTLPDLDVLTTPFLTPPEALASHRGITHSIFLGLILSPLIAALLKRLLSDYQLSYRRLLVFVWLAVSTHWMIDCLTMYGTQIFQPFSNFPVNIGSVFIIDPLYTLPLIYFLWRSVLVNRKSEQFDPRPIAIGLIVSTCYLGLTLASKYTIEHRLKSAWLETGRSYEQMITVPTPFNSILFYAYVDTGEDIWVTDGSLFDSPERPVSWQRVPKNLDLLPNFEKGSAGECLVWFSRGFYRLDLVDGKPFCTDLRFGRLRGWFREHDPADTDYMFRYRLLPPDADAVYESFDGPLFDADLSLFPWRDMWTRMWGGDLE